MNPITHTKYFIYDVLFSPENEIVIISPWETIFNYKLVLPNNQNKEFKMYENNTERSGHHNYVYRCQVEKYEPTIKLLINNSDIIETKVNIYKTFENKLIMSTMVKNEDNYILQWINYHKKLGIDHFVIYDNKESEHLSQDYKNQPWQWITHDDIRKNNKGSNLEKLLKDYIENGTVLLINWPYKYVLEKSGVSGLSTQQCHSLYAFRNSKYIAYFDVDEYINPQTTDYNIENIIQEYITKNNIDYNSIGGLTLKCKLFFNPYNKSEKDFDFLRIYDCDNFTPFPHRVKNFAIPKNVNTWCVHEMANGKSTINIDEKIMYFNHYFYLNKNRGKDNKNLIDNTIERLLIEFNI